MYYAGDQYTELNDVVPFSFFPAVEYWGVHGTGKGERANINGTPERDKRLLSEISSAECMDQVPVPVPVYRQYVVQHRHIELTSVVRRSHVC